jgi:hypothetical protein
MNDKLLYILRSYRIIALLLTAFALYWGWDAYQFVNTHYESMSDFVIAFYISIVGVAGWVIKNWMTTKAVDK